MKASGTPVKTPALIQPPKINPTHAGQASFGPQQMGTTVGRMPKAASVDFAALLAYSREKLSA
jgi:hypothetical protein